MNRKLIAVLIVCLTLRIIIFAFQKPFNNDNHFEVVRYIAETKTLPSPFQFEQGQHPPLYYILASMFLRLGGAKTVQFFSLLLSLGTICVFYLLIKKLDFIGERNKVYCLLFAGVLPQFILFGNFISNDSLSIFIGSLIFLQASRYISKPNLLNQVILTLILSAGMLTKATFTVFIPVVLVLIIFMNIRNRVDIKRILVVLLLSAEIIIVVGGFKYLQNYMLYRNPTLNAEDILSKFYWVRNTYTGLNSFYDINITKLIKKPYVSDQTKHSYPLMLYGTFWYQYIWESNFIGNSNIFKYIGSLIYILAINPTIIILAGLLMMGRNAFKLFGYERLSTGEFYRFCLEAFALFLLVANISFIFYAGIKYDAWIFFQSRYFFLSFFAVVLAFNAGLDLARTSRLVSLLFALLLVVFVFYISVSIYAA
jgi:4-amino-4-deoxy-L-arabinose transferase-like glycosyltransferase